MIFIILAIVLIILATRIHTTDAATKLYAFSIIMVAIFVGISYELPAVTETEFKTKETFELINYDEIRTIQKNGNSYYQLKINKPNGCSLKECIASQTKFQFSDDNSQPYCVECGKYVPKNKLWYLIGIPEITKEQYIIHIPSNTKI